MTAPDEFIRLAGELVFTPEQSCWDRLPAERQAEFCRRARKTGWEMLWLCTLNRKLPAEFYARTRQAYQQEALKQMLKLRQLTELYRLLEAEKIPFLPVKGADLAYRIYPDSIMRPYNDWDLLFRKEDCPRVLALLQAEKWQTFSGCDGDEDDPEYHFERRHKNGQSLEVHWTLPKFGTASPEEIWAETRGQTGCRRVLTPEMNLLLISAHAALRHYTHLSPWRILPDAGYLLKHEAVDWHKVHQLADRWEILRPDILFSAWSEFFPAGILPGGLIPEHGALIRKVFALHAGIGGCTHYEKAVSEPEERRWSWFAGKLRACVSRRALCIKYRVKPGSSWKIPFLSFYDLMGKTLYFFRHLRSGETALQHYYRHVEAVEMLVNRQHPDAGRH